MISGEKVGEAYTCTELLNCNGVHLLPILGHMVRPISLRRTMAQATCLLQRFADQWLWMAAVLNIIVYVNWRNHIGEINTFCLHEIKL